MKKKLRIVLAQLNLHVGDITYNLNKHIESATLARDQLQADIIVFPELSITGYPPEDLLFRKDFLDEADRALHKMTQEIKNIYCLVSHPARHSQGLFNASSLIFNGEIIAHYAKQILPNYGVFDECRYFVSGNTSCVTSIQGIPTGLVICEDLWSAAPLEKVIRAGARLILSPNASPFETDKHEQRLKILSQRAKDHHVPIIYVNNVGAQDELVFDGGSMVINAQGELCQFASFFNETLLPVDIEFD